MKILKVLMVGFSLLNRIIFRPFICELFRVKTLEETLTLSDLLKEPRKTLIDFVVLSRQCLGFDVERNLEKVAVKYPEAKIACASHLRILQNDGRRCMDGGADLLLFNFMSDEELRRAKAAIENNRRYIPDEILNAASVPSCESELGSMRLTKNERIAFYHDLHGLSVKEVAAVMHVSVGTASCVRSRYRLKLGVHSHHELICKSIEMDLLSLEDLLNM